MSGVDANNVLTAILAAIVFAMTLGLVGKMLFQPEQLAQQVYAPEVAEAVPTAAEAPAAAAIEPIGPLLAAADVDAGKKTAKKCTACHTFDEGGAQKIGPNLWNVVDRNVSAVSGYGYSAALEGKSGESWSYENLNLFLIKPKDWAPGTKMAFAGLKKAKDRANLIAYLRSLSSNPAPLPQ